MKNRPKLNLSDINFILEKYDLVKYYKYFLQNNTALNAPYHNVNHTLSVMLFSYELAVEMKNDNLNIRNLLIASLFHDMNHSVGKLTDDKNIENAIDAFKKISTENEDDNLNIIDIISSTQYPYTFPNDSATLEQLIIRDADLLQGVRDDYFQQVVIGLSTEFKQKLFDFLPNQIKFWETVTYNTQHANRLWNEVKENRINHIKSLLNV